MSGGFKKSSDDLSNSSDFQARRNPHELDILHWMYWSDEIALVEGDCACTSRVENNEHVI
jgi:hypothetical protein